MKFLDIETDMSAPVTSNIVTINIDGVVYERRKLGDDGLRAVLEPLKCETICAHYAKFDTKTIYQNFGILLDKVWCTQVAAKILRNGMKNKDGSPVSNALVDVLDYYLGVREEIHKDKKELRTKYSLKRDLTPRELEYIKADVVHLPILQAKLAEAIERDKLGFVFNEEMRLLPCIVEMEVGGINFDTERLRYLLTVWKRGKRIVTGMLDRELRKLLVFNRKPSLFSAYNYGSPTQMLSLFRDHSLPVPTKLERIGNKQVRKESSDYAALVDYLNQYPTTPLKRFLEIFFWYKEIEKLISTYGEPLLNAVDSNGYIHTEFNQLGAETGRLSSKSPNLQVIPNSGHGAKIRGCFLPDKGHVLIDCDMKQAEMRLAADYSNDALLKAAILEGVDLHSRLASMSFTSIFGQPVEIKDTKDTITISGHTFVLSKLRTEHKSVVFASFYKAGAPRIKAILGKYLRLFCVGRELEVAQEISDRLYQEMPGLSAYLSRLIKDGTTRGVARTFKSNRIRYFDKDAYGNICNYPIQSANAEAMKVAMIRIRQLVNPLKGRLLITVHDQSLTSVPASLAAELGPQIANIMSESLQYFMQQIPGGSTYKQLDKWEK